MFKAKSLFGSTSRSIARIYSPNLRSDLSLTSFDASLGTIALSGTPSFASTTSYTATAVDVCGNSGSIQFGVSSVQDVVTITPFAVPQFTFVIGRPVTSDLSGYYLSSNLTVAAQSSTGQTISFAYDAFTQVGITASVQSNQTGYGTQYSLTFGGTPTSLLSPLSTQVLATDGLPGLYGSSAASPIIISVADDIFTWSNLLANFQQNRQITPIQLSATTLSGRVVTSYVTSNLPIGLYTTRSGLIQGTCYGNAKASYFVANASTGISTQSRNFSYSVSPESLLVISPSNSYTLTPGAAVSIPTIQRTYSGMTPTNLSLSSPSYGLTISQEGTIGGILQAMGLPTTVTPIYVTARVGITDVSSAYTLVSVNSTTAVLSTSVIDSTIQLTSPSIFDYSIMQYTTLSPITLQASTVKSYFFIDSNTLPRGIQFDPLTGIFSGTAVLTGSTTSRVYVTAGTYTPNGSLKYNYFDFTFNAFSPYPQKRQDMASAYTAYVRQEAIIAGAQFSRDSNALPSENTTIGAAMGPPPPEVITAPEPCC
jgi:hypothetical protein